MKQVMHHYNIPMEVRTEPQNWGLFLGSKFRNFALGRFFRAHRAGCLHASREQGWNEGWSMDSRALKFTLQVEP